MELPEEIHDSIKDLSAAGDALAESDQFDAALSKYWEAFDLLPEPKTKWEAGTWLLTAIGDANFLKGDFVAGRDNLSNAMHFPDAVGNPFLHLRLGQCQYEVGNLDRATDELLRAYGLEGAEIFESEDPKYLLFLRSRVPEPEPAKKKPFWKFW